MNLISLKSVHSVLLWLISLITSFGYNHAEIYISLNSCVSSVHIINLILVLAVKNRVKLYSCYY